jgi:DNA-binding PadR family transcriptional regulator
MVRPVNRLDEAQPPLTHVVYHILLSLTEAPRHGYGIIKDVEARTRGRLELEAGTLYGAIKRLREDGWIAEAVAPTGADRRRRYYTLTPQGRVVLRVESERLAELVEMARHARVLPGSAGA